MKVESFPPEVVAELKHYVYRLIDPRNGETFYVGKGKGNRVFAHCRAAIESEDDSIDKLRRIREIHAGGFEVAHVIHRHGMNEETAFEVEGALIDAYPGLTNVVGGAGNTDHGVMHAQEIVTRYHAAEAEFSHRAILINVGKSMLNTSLYEAVRYAWKLSVERAEKAEVILAVQQGLIVGVFCAEQWMPATETNFPGRESVPGRFGFVGKQAPPELLNACLKKRVPVEYRKRGSSNPIKYTYK